MNSSTCGSNSTSLKGADIYTNHIANEPSEGLWLLYLQVSNSDMSETFVSEFFFFLSYTRIAFS